MGSTLTTADAVLKEDYKSPIVDQLNNGNILLAAISRNTDDMSGRRFVRPIHLARNSGVGARAEAGTLPTAGNQGYVDIIGPARYNYARIGLTGPVIAAMAKSRTSFTRGVDSEVSGATNDSKRDVCRQAWGTSDGKLATCGTTSTSNTVTLASTTRTDQLRALDNEFLIDVGSSTSAPTSIASARSVSAVDYSAKTFTISGATISTVNNTSVITRSGAGGASSNSGNPGDGQIEWTGIQSMIDASTSILHTVNPSTYPKWASTVNGNSGTNRAISENLVTTAIMDTEVKSGKVINLLVSGDGVFRAYANLLTSLKRITDSVKLPGGFSGISVGYAQSGRNSDSDMLALTWDRDCPSNRLYGLSTSSFELMVEQDWDWITGPVDNILVQTDNVDAYTATLRHYGEFTCNQRNANFVIQDITEA